MGKKSKEKKPMSLKRKTLSVVVKTILALLAFLLVSVTVFAVMFWDTFVNIVKNPAVIPYIINNWDAFSKGLNVTTSELEVDEKVNAKNQANAFSEANINLGEEDIAKLSEQDMSDEERAAIIYNAMISGDLNVDTSSDEKDKVTGDAFAGDGIPAKDEKSDEKSESSGVQTDSITNNSNDKQKPSDDKKKDPATDTQLPSGNNPAVNVPPSDVSNNSSMPKPENSGTQTGTDISGMKMTEEQYNMKVAELVAKMYSIKADFVSKLSSFENDVIAQYKALPADQRTTAAKSKIVSENMNYIMGLEAQCDAQVQAVTSELTSIMVANGKSTALVDQINAAYINEKEIKKAYYVSLYK